MESSTGFSLFSFGHLFVHSQLKSKKTGIFVRDVSPFFKGLLQLTVQNTEGVRVRDIVLVIGFLGDEHDDDNDADYDDTEPLPA